jgi:hypothetical protein
VEWTWQLKMDRDATARSVDGGVEKRAAQRGGRRRVWAAGGGWLLSRLAWAGPPK